MIFNEEEFEMHIEKTQRLLEQVVALESRINLEYRRLRLLLLSAPEDWRPTRHQAEMCVLAGGGDPGEVLGDASN